MINWSCCHIDSFKKAITYVHNWSLQPFNQDYDLAFHTTYVVCVNVMHGWRDFWETFHENFIYSNSSYIHNWPLKPFSHVYDQASHTTYVVYVNFMTGEIYSLKSTSYDRFLRSFFMAILFTLRAFKRNLLKWSRRRNIFIFSFWCLTCDLNSALNV